MRDGKGYDTASHINSGPIEFNVHFRIRPYLSRHFMHMSCADIYLRIYKRIDACT